MKVLLKDIRCATDEGHSVNSQPHIISYGACDLNSYIWNTVNYVAQIFSITCKCWYLQMLKLQMARLTIFLIFYFKDNYIQIKALRGILISLQTGSHLQAGEDTVKSVSTQVWLALFCFSLRCSLSGPT